MAIRAFSREYLVGELGLPYDNDGIVINDEIKDTKRWYTVHELTFRDPATSKVYKCFYSEGATEAQDESPWEYDRVVACEEVELRPVLEMRYVPVGKQPSKEELLKSVAAVKRYQQELEGSPVLSAAFGEGYVRGLFEGMSADEVCTTVDGLLSGNTPSANRQENKAGGVPDRFVEKLIEKANELYREAEESFEAIVWGNVVCLQQSSSAKQSCSVPLDAMFSFYKEQKQAGEKRPMLRTAEKLRDMVKEQVRENDDLGREPF